MQLLNLTEILPRYLKKTGGRNRRFPDTFFAPPPAEEREVLDKIEVFGVRAFAPPLGSAEAREAAVAVQVEDGHWNRTEDMDVDVDVSVSVSMAVTEDHSRGQERTPTPRDAFRDHTRGTERERLFSPEPMLPAARLAPLDTPSHTSILSELSTPQSMVSYALTAPRSRSRSPSRSRAAEWAADEDDNGDFPHATPAAAIPAAALPHTQPRPPPPLRRIGSSSPASPLPIKKRPRVSAGKRHAFKTWMNPGVDEEEGEDEEDGKGGDTDSDDLSEYERARRKAGGRGGTRRQTQAETQTQAHRQAQAHTHPETRTQTEATQKTDDSLPQSQDSSQFRLARYSTAHDMENEDESVRVEQQQLPAAIVEGDENEHASQHVTNSSNDADENRVLVPTTTDESDPRNAPSKITQSSPAVGTAAPPSSGVQQTAANPCKRKRPRTSTATNASADADDEGQPAKRGRLQGTQEEVASTPARPPPTLPQQYSSEITEPSPDYRRPAPAETPATPAVPGRKSAVPSSPSPAPPAAGTSALRRQPAPAPPTAAAATSTPAHAPQPPRASTSPPAQVPNPRASTSTPAQAPRPPRASTSTPAQHRRQSTSTSTSPMKRAKLNGWKPDLSVPNGLQEHVVRHMAADIARARAKLEAKRKEGSVSGARNVRRT